MSEYTKGGGPWLGAARSWVQWNCKNGSDVTWGSNEELVPPLTIRQVEELAARVTDAAIPEMDELKEQLEKTCEKRLRAEGELEYARKVVVAARKWAKLESTSDEAGTNTGITKDIKSCVAEAILKGLGPKED